MILFIQLKLCFDVANFVDWLNIYQQLPLPTRTCIQHSEQSDKGRTSTQATYKNGRSLHINTYQYNQDDDSIK